MNYKPLSDLEKYQMLTIINECGPAEVLRLVGQWLAHVSSDIEEGTGLRYAINLLAKKAQNIKQRE